MTGGLTGLLDKIKLHFEGVVFKSYVTGAVTVYPKVVMSFLNHFLCNMLHVSMRKASIL